MSIVKPVSERVQSLAHVESRRLQMFAANLKQLADNHRRLAGVAGCIENGVSVIFEAQERIANQMLEQCNRFLEIVLEQSSCPSCGRRR